jgi:hypothetical protein
MKKYIFLFSCKRINPVLQTELFYKCSFHSTNIELSPSGWQGA